MLNKMSVKCYNVDYFARFAVVVVVAMLFCIENNQSKNVCCYISILN